MLRCWGAIIGDRNYCWRAPIGTAGTDQKEGRSYGHDYHRLSGSVFVVIDHTVLSRPAWRRDPVARRCECLVREMCELVVHKKRGTFITSSQERRKGFGSKWFVLYERFGGKRFQQHDAPYTKCDLRRWHLGVLLDGGRKACIFRSRRSNIVALYQHRGICFSSSSRRGKERWRARYLYKGCTQRFAN